MFEIDQHRKPDTFGRRLVAFWRAHEGFSLRPQGILARGLSADGFANDRHGVRSERVIKATLMGMRVVEVPTTLSRDGRSRSPHLRPQGWLEALAVHDPFQSQLPIPLPRTGSDVCGISTWAKLLASPGYIHGVRLSVDTLIYSRTMIEVGFQAILLALLSRDFRGARGIFFQRQACSLI
jgi:hypothetical protein